MVGLFTLPGILVPKATNTMAVTASAKPIVQPKCDAISPMKAVRMPITNMHTVKHGQPSP